MFKTFDPLLRSKATAVSDCNPQRSRLLYAKSSILVLSLAIASSAGADWTRVAIAGGTADSPSDSIFLDLATIKSLGPNFTVWTLLDSDHDETVQGVTYRSQKLLKEFDCAGDRSRVLGYIVNAGQMGEGSVVSTELQRVEPYPWHSIAPETMSRTVERAVCDGGAVLKPAATWKPLPSDGKHAAFYEPASLRRNGPLVHVRTMADYSSPIHANGVVWRSAVYDDEIDCGANTLRTYAEVSYAGPRTEGAPVQLLVSDRPATRMGASNDDVARVANFLCDPALRNTSSSSARQRPKNPDRGLTADQLHDANFGPGSATKRSK